MKWDKIGLANAVKGVVAAVRKERNLKIQLVFGITVTVMGFLFSISRSEWLALVITTGLVLMAELFNTAVERAVDVSCRDILADELQKNPRRENAGMAKDIAAGAVLVAAGTAMVVGAIIFLPRIGVFLAALAVF